MSHFQQCWQNPDSQAQSRHNSLNKQPTANVLPGTRGVAATGAGALAGLSHGSRGTHGVIRRGCLGLLGIRKLFLVGACEAQPGWGSEQATSVPL